MLCHYCLSQATGINYRPSKDMNNILSCQKHATSLYISFGTSSSNMENLFSKIMDSVIQELQIIKAQAVRIEQSISNLSLNNFNTFSLDCKLTNPYIVIAKDEDLAFSLILKRLKIKQERLKIQNQRLKMMTFNYKNTQKYPQTPQRTQKDNKNDRFWSECRGSQTERTKTDLKFSRFTQKPLF